MTPQRPNFVELLALFCVLTLPLYACRSAPSPAPSPAPAVEAPAIEAAAVVERAPAPEVTIGAGGDVLVHIKVARSAGEHADEGGYAHVFGELRALIDDDAIAFLNLETPLSTQVTPRTGSTPILGAPPDVAPALAAVGVDVASVANNHAFDQTVRGLEETLDALEQAGIRAVGARASERDAPGPVVLERNGLSVAFLAFTERINQGPVYRDPRLFVARFDREEADAALERARSQADVVVVSIHWSHDFYDAPMGSQRELARWLIDEGADLILGHGPHVLQVVERFESARGDAACAYSLGNLVSNQGLRFRPGRPIPADVHPAILRPESRDGAWLRVRFVRRGGRLHIEALEAVPLWTHNNFLAVASGREERLDIRVRPLRAIDPALRDRRRPIIARTLGEAVRLLD